MPSHYQRMLTPPAAAASVAARPAEEWPSLPGIACISLWQPWASLIFIGVKHHETRHWPYPARLEGQRIAIHAAKHMVHNPGQHLERALEKAYGADWRRIVPRGAVMGTARLSGCFPTEVAAPESILDQLAGNWEPERFAWKLTEIDPLDQPIVMRGQQSLWTIEIPA